MPETLTIEDIVELGFLLVKGREKLNDRRFTKGKNAAEMKALAFSICPICKKLYPTEDGTTDCECDMDDPED